MIDNVCRNFIARYTDSVVKLYRWIGMTPNHVSILGFLISVCAAVSLAKGYYWSSLLLWWISRIADGTDGMYARAIRKTSSFGAYIDIVLDMAAYGGMILALFYLRPDLHTRWLIILYLYSLCITSSLALGMGEASSGISKRDNRGLRLGAGLAEAGETGIYYTACMVFPASIGLFASVWIGVLSLTVIARSALAYRTFSKNVVI